LVSDYIDSYPSNHKKRHPAAGSVAPERGTVPETKSWDSGKGTVLAVERVVLDVDGVVVDDYVLATAAVVTECDEVVVARMVLQYWRSRQVIAYRPGLEKGTEKKSAYENEIATLLMETSVVNA